MNIKSTIKFKSFNVYKLNKILFDLKKFAEANSLESKLIHLPNTNKKFTVLRSPHVHKKARDQFELKSFTKVLQIEGTVIATKKFLNILEQELLEDITYFISLKKFK